MYWNFFLSKLWDHYAKLRDQSSVWSILDRSSQDYKENNGSIRHSCDRVLDLLKPKCQARYTNERSQGVGPQVVKSPQVCQGALCLAWPQNRPFRPGIQPQLMMRSCSFTNEENRKTPPMSSSSSCLAPHV